MRLTSSRTDFLRAKRLNPVIELTDNIATEFPVIVAGVRLLIEISFMVHWSTMSEVVMRLKVEIGIGKDRGGRLIIRTFAPAFVLSVWWSDMSVKVLFLKINECTLVMIVSTENPVAYDESGPVGVVVAGL